jgi:hypothetical protein
MEIGKKPFVCAAILGFLAPVDLPDDAMCRPDREGQEVAVDENVFATDQQD